MIQHLTTLKTLRSHPSQQNIRPRKFPYLETPRTVMYRSVPKSFRLRSPRMRRERPAAQLLSPRPRYVERGPLVPFPFLELTRGAALLHRHRTDANALLLPSHCPVGNCTTRVVVPPTTSPSFTAPTQLHPTKIRSGLDVSPSVHCSPPNRRIMGRPVRRVSLFRTC